MAVVKELRGSAAIWSAIRLMGGSREDETGLRRISRGSAEYLWDTC